MFFEPKYIPEEGKPQGKGLIGRIKSALNAVYLVFRKFLHKSYLFLKPIVEFYYKELRKLPWKIIVPVIASVLLIIWLVFHFYIANQGRILNNFDSNTQQLDDITSSIKFTDVAFSNSPIYNLDGVLGELNSLSQEVTDSNVSLPSKRATVYAFRGEDSATRDRVDSLYLNGADLTADQVSESLNGLIVVSQLANDLFSKDIREDTRSYIEFLDNSRDIITEVDNDSADLNFKTISKIFSHIQLSAEQYLETNDYEQFNRQYSNVSSELIKEIDKSWDETVNGPYLIIISTQLHTQEAILNTFK